MYSLIGIKWAVRKQTSDSFELSVYMFAIFVCYDVSGSTLACTK